MPGVSPMSLFDLSHPISPATPVFPGDDPVGVRTVATHADRGYAARRLDLGTHSGTHVDAPAHLLAGGATLDQLPLDLWIGPGVLLDRADLAAGPLPRVERLLIRGCPDGITPDEARRIAASGVRIVGVDGPSIDPVASRELPAHRILLGAGIPVLENLRLDGVPSGPGTLYCLPLPVAGGDGAPVRAVWRREPVG